MSVSLKTRLIELSTSQDWEAAKLEWSLTNIYIAEVNRTCLCGHYPIKEVCEIYNKTNQTLIEVGNHCLKGILNMPETKIINGAKACMKDPAKPLTDSLINFAFTRKLIDETDKHFIYEVRKLLKNKRRLLANQVYKLKHLRQVVLASFQRN